MTRAKFTYGKSTEDAIDGHAKGRTVRESIEPQLKLAAAPEPSTKPRKYRNQPVIADGIRFDSKAEHQRWCALKLLAQLGQISELKVHPVYGLTSVRREDGEKKQVRKFCPDFTYKNELGEFVVEDVKSPQTRRNRDYRTKKAFFEWEYGLTVVEVTK